MTTRRVTKQDLLLLKRHLQDKANLSVHRPSGKFRDRFVIPTYDATPGADDHVNVPDRSHSGAYLQMYDWDACMFAQLAHRVGVEELPQAIVGNFLRLQERQGFVPRTISPGRIWDQGDLCKPFLSQTLLHAAQRRPQEAAVLVQPFLSGLERFLDFWKRNRRHESGLFTWRSVLESGVDDSYALLSPREAAKDEEKTCVAYPDGRLLAADLNSYMVAELRAFARLADICGDHDKAHAVRQEARLLARTIEQKLYDRSLKMYVHVDPDRNEPVRIRCWTGLAPVLFDVSSRSRALRVLRDTVLNEQHFLRPYGIASLAASESLYNQAPRGLYGRAIVCNWNGPIWILPNALTVRCLLRHNLTAEAKDVSRRVVAAMVKGLRERGTLFENYNAETGAALWAPHFMSWNIMALEMIELLEGKWQTMSRTAA